jgi:RHS repeat-associated protein
MTNDGQNNSMVYDAENRLVRINSGSATYSYDGNSLRAEKVSGGATTVYIYSGTKVIGEYENGGAPSAPTQEYIYSGLPAVAGGALLAKIEGGTTTYYHADQLSVRLMTDTSGNVIGQQGHYPFGESWYQNNTTTKWMFTSYERDAESGNDYAMARYDVNRLGRFASPDLLAGSASDPQSLDRYLYVRDDPVNLVDPLGLRDNDACALTHDCLGGAGLRSDEGCGGPFSLGCDGGGTVYIVDGMAVSASVGQGILNSGFGAECPFDACTVTASDGQLATYEIYAGLGGAGYETQATLGWAPTDLLRQAVTINGVLNVPLPAPIAYLPAPAPGQCRATGAASAECVVAFNAGSDQSYTQAKLAALQQAGQMAHGPANAAFYAMLGIAALPVAPEAAGAVWTTAASPDVQYPLSQIGLGMAQYEMGWGFPQDSLQQVGYVLGAIIDNLP